MNWKKLCVEDRAAHHNHFSSSSSFVIDKATRWLDAKLFQSSTLPYTVHCKKKGASDMSCTTILSMICLDFIAYSRRLAKLFLYVVEKGKYYSNSARNVVRKFVFLTLHSMRTCLNLLLFFFIWSDQELM